MPNVRCAVKYRPRVKMKTWIPSQPSSLMGVERKLTVPLLSSLLDGATCSVGGGEGVAMMLASCCRERKEEVVGNTHASVARQTRVCAPDVT